MEERECTTHAKDILSSFQRLKLDKTLCDFTLKLGNEEIQVHRAFLAACSKYYEAMFFHDMKETKTGHAEISGIEPSAGKQCIEFLYTGKVKFSCENPKDLIHAADMMQLHDLMDLHFEFLFEKISPKNCLEYMELAQTYNQHSFAKVFEKFSIENFTGIVESESFGSMNETLFLQCVGSLVDGGQEMEILKWEAVTKWVKADVENRGSIFCNLFKLLSLECLADEFIKTDMYKEPLVIECGPCTKLAFDALCLRGQPVNVANSESKSGNIIACHTESRMLHRLDLETEAWSRIARIPVETFRKRLDIVSLDGAIYLGSGDALVKFSNGKWTTVLDVGIQTCFNRCLLKEKCIFMIKSDCTIQYDTEKQTSTEITSELGLGEGFFVTYSKDCLYAMGGKNTEKLVREFDLDTKTWEPLASMQYARIDGAAIFFDKVYVLGGFRYQLTQYSGVQKVPQATVEYYTPSMNNWTSVATGCLKCGWYNRRGLLHGSTVYIVGGGQDVVQVIDWNSQKEAKKIKSVKIDSLLSCF